MKRRRARPLRGLAAAATVVSMLPASAPAIADRIGATHFGVTRLLLDLRRVGIARVVGVEHRGRMRSRANVIDMIPPSAGVQCDQSLKRMTTRGSLGRRVPLQALEFRSLWQALDAGGTVSELHEETGLGLLQLRRALSALHDGGRARIAEWEKSPSRTPVGVWRLGFGPHAKRPAKEPRAVTNRRYREAVAARSSAARICFALAGVEAA